MQIQVTEVQQQSCSKGEPGQQVRRRGGISSSSPHSYVSPAPLITGPYNINIWASKIEDYVTWTPGTPMANYHSTFWKSTRRCELSLLTIPTVTNKETNKLCNSNNNPRTAWLQDEQHKPKGAIPPFWEILEAKLWAVGRDVSQWSELQKGVGKRGQRKYYKLSIPEPLQTASKGLQPWLLTWRHPVVCSQIHQQCHPTISK